MISNEINCAICEKHIAWSKTGSLDSIICDECTEKENEKFMKQMEGVEELDEDAPENN